MKLVSVRVTNFRSVNDSGEFAVGDLTCLVGKNESGKTTVLQGLAGLEPLGGDPKLKYDKQRDYPRRYLSRYGQRHEDGDAVVVRTVWELGQDDVEAVEQVLGPNCLKTKAVSVSRGFEGTRHWGLELDEAAIVAHLSDQSGLSKSERTSLKGLTTVGALRAAIKGKDGTGGLQTLAKTIDGFRKGSVILAAINILQELTPGFLYFSNYDRMVGDVSLDHLQAAKTNKTVSNEQAVYLAFLELAGTNPDDLAKAGRYEELKAQVESASITITEQIFEYWSQNRHLQVEFDVSDGKPDDPAPLNQGRIMHARIRNDLHKMTVPFNDRSAGFIWFFSFLVLFSQTVKQHGNVIILLDEPGLNLHATAQGDLLRYIRERLLPNHQVIYTTHSPFMVPTDDLSSVRTVEDVVRQDQHGRPESVGTTVKENVLSTDRETLFPLQGALGYGITQSLFVGENTLLVEGPGEILYFQVISTALEKRGRKWLDRRWTPCPANGVDKVHAFLSLFGGNKLHCAVLLDLAKGQKGKVQKVRDLENTLLRQGHVFTVADFLGKDEADIEDLFHPSLYAQLLNGAFELKGEKKITGQALVSEDAQGTDRLVRKAELVINRILPPGEPEMSHYAPALWLLRNPEVLDDDAEDVAETLNGFEKVFVAFNALL